LIFWSELEKEDDDEHEDDLGSEEVRRDADALPT
jgi:hypothetical protein